MECCENCRFYRTKKGKPYGRCHIRIPEIGKMDKAVWPTVDPEEWCGEWETAKEPKRRFPKKGQKERVPLKRLLASEHQETTATHAADLLYEEVAKLGLVDQAAIFVGDKGVIYLYHTKGRDQDLLWSTFGEDWLGFSLELVCARNIPDSSFYHYQSFGVPHADRGVESLASHE